MNNYDVIDFVDLTNSFTLVDHCNIANSVIDLDTDDSIIEDNVMSGSPLHLRSANTSQSHRDIINETEVVANKQPHPKQKKSQKNKKLSLNESTNPEQYKFGSCPICWDELGKNPLVSTKCGHVYCLKCLERYMCSEKKCPTCRCILKGKNAYHPLYLPV